MQVFVLTQGQYDDMRIIGVYSTEEKATEDGSKLKSLGEPEQHWNVEEFELIS